MSGGKQCFIETKKLSYQALDPISFYCVACFLGYGDAQPSNPLFIAACYSRKVLRTSPHPLVVYSPVIAFVINPFRFAVRMFFHAYRLYDNPESLNDKFIR
jgi:hypothetical protein